MAIPITSVTGGSSGGNLVNCNFELVSTSPDIYQFSSSSGVLATGVKSGKAFKVTDFKGLDWTITASISGATASGDWHNTHHFAPIPGDEEGTFQAQAGGSGDPPPETTSSASA